MRMEMATDIHIEKDMGMDNVLDMEDGFTKWKIQDLPVDYLT